MIPDYVQRSQALRDKRIAELKELGVKASRGQCLGQITINAGDIPAIIRLLKKAAKA